MSESCISPVIGGKGAVTCSLKPLVNTVQEAIQAAREFASCNVSPFSIINMHKYFCSVLHNNYAVHFFDQVFKAI